MKKFLFIWALLFLFIGNGDHLHAAQDDWHDSFDIICARTADAGELSSKELKKLISDSDKLLKIIESSDDLDKKVYLTRLKKCKNLFVFMIEIKDNSGQK